ncbi:MAG: FtsX-like permease family protein, partial [Solirubrobacteraceae bacterium]
RAIGVPRLAVAAEHATSAALLGAGAGAIGVAAGTLTVLAPAAGVLEALNEQAPGSAAVTPLLATWAGIVLVATLAAGWPAWRAAGRPPVELLRGGTDLGATGAGTRLARGGGFLVLGMRLALARPRRALAAIAVLSVCGGVLALMLGLSSLVLALRDDPGSVGKRYELTARLPAEATSAVRAIPGVVDAAPRYLARGADSFALGEPVKLVSFAGDHTRFEAPALADGRRIRSDGEAEVGTGLAQALGVGVGGQLAVQLPSGSEARFRVVGTVRAIDDDGRVAYVRPRRLLAAEPSLSPTIAIRLTRGADRAAVGRALRRLGAEPAVVGAATTRSTSFLGSLATLLRAVGLIDALVCLYALSQALGLTARERRPTLALLRCAGASRGVILRVLAGAALVLAVPAALLALVLAHVVFAPLVAGGAVGYTDLQPTPSSAQAAGLAAAFVVLALLAAALVGRRVLREAVVDGLRDA